ncbi:MAG: Membrane protein oxaA [Gemmatimonadetes bacterium]|jgi:YidC/Oxa1 family membrane protein insertase|nr:Membrane protein oxaA [Gemmatimonadota bacterium]
MDKRFFLALLLTAIVVIATPLLFPDTTRRTVPRIAVDSSARQARTTDSAHATAATATAPAAVNSVGALPNAPATTGAVVAETTTVHAQRSTYAFSSRGAAPISVVLDSYPSRRPTTTGAPKAAELARPHTPLTHYRLALGRDTVALDTVALQPDARAIAAGGAGQQLSYSGVAAGHPVRVDYTFVPDSFIVRVRATVADAPAGSALLVDLPRTLASNEPDTTEDIGHLAVSYRTAHGEVSSVPFGKVDSAETRVQAGPLTWVATRNKYFLIAYRTEPNTPFSALRMTGMPRHEKLASDLLATASLPLTNGTAAFDVYAGPQDSQRLQRLGSDLDQVNPYGGWLNGIVQPFATIVVNVLLWVKRTTQLNYGWVLVIFGVGIRLALWPLNQGALRTSMKMQRLQPELQAIQKKYSDDPKRQQEAIMKVYKDHGMSPLSPLMGCLPMLLPMPILFALYHVFQNTVEFRGVSFLWLPDISLADPYYIAPLLMGVSMFVMSWISMKNSPPNPQAKMMTFMMPVVLTVVFFKFASGLNLYYAVQNIAALPQTWLISRERAKQAPLVPTVQGPSAAIKRRS